MGCIFSKQSPLNGDNNNINSYRNKNTHTQQQQLDQLYYQHQIILQQQQQQHHHIIIEDINIDNNMEDFNFFDYIKRKFNQTFFNKSYNDNQQQLLDQENNIQQQNNVDLNNLPSPSIIITSSNSNVNSNGNNIKNNNVNMYNSNNQNSNFISIGSNGGYNNGSFYCGRPRSNTKETLRVHKKRHKDGHKMVNEYVFVRKLGRGTYGKVKLAYHIDTHQLYAIKIFNKIRLKKQTMGFGKPNAFDQVLKEIAIMKKMNHPNVVKLYEVIDDEDGECIYIVMEYVEGGNLQQINDSLNLDHPMSEQLALKYFRDIILGLEYLHEQKVIHRDIKPENLLLNKDGVVKIGDFGVSQIFEDDDIIAKCTTAGSIAFHSPELCSEDHSIPIAGKPIDIWACGITLYYLIFGKVPFNSNSILNIYDQILNQEVIFTREISNELKDLFKGLLDKNPATRITIESIKSHPWTTINGTMQMKESDHLILSVTDQEMNEAISADHTIKDDDLSSSSESSGIIGSSTNSDKFMYQQQQQQQPPYSLNNSINNNSISISNNLYYSLRKNNSFNTTITSTTPSSNTINNYFNNNINNNNLVNFDHYNENDNDNDFENSGNSIYKPLIINNNNNNNNNKSNSKSKNVNISSERVINQIDSIGEIDNEKDFNNNNNNNNNNGNNSMDEIEIQ